MKNNDTFGKFELYSSCAGFFLYILVKVYIHSTKESRKLASSAGACAFQQSRVSPSTGSTIRYDNSHPGQEHADDLTVPVA